MTTTAAPATVTAVDPTTGKAIGTYPLQDAAAVDAILDAAVAAARRA